MEDFEFNGKRHFAVWQGKTPVILIGYSRKQNNVLVVSIDSLPEDERNELISIALNENMQNRLELASTLYNTKHTKSGETWMTNIVSRLRRGDNSVTTAYVKNLENVTDEQLAFYKGYGPKPKLQISEAEKLAVLGGDYQGKTTSSSVTPTPQVGNPSIVEAPESNQTAAALSQIAQAMMAMSGQLARIDEKLSVPVAAPAPKKVKKPKVAKEEGFSPVVTPSVVD